MQVPDIGDLKIGVYQVGRNNQRALRRMYFPSGAMRYAYCTLRGLPVPNFFHH